MPRTQSTTVGDMEIIALTDGHTEFGKDIFPTTDPDKIDKILKAQDQTAIQTNFNAFLVKSGGETVLVDAGPRDLFGDTCGNLPKALEEAGVAAEDITHVYLTHMHPDHIAGTITPEGQPVFTRATLLVGAEDHAFWSKETFSDETLAQWQGLAQAVLAAYKGNTDTFDGETEIIKGMWSQHLVGHTPGHYGFRIDGGRSGFLHMGDIAHAQHLQFADPSIGTAFDVDPQAAEKTRKRTLDMATTDGLLVSGGHMLAPKFGYLGRDGAGYAFEAA